MRTWVDALPYDPLPPLLGDDHPAISRLVQRELLDQPVALTDLWSLPAPQRILRNQTAQGSWVYPGARLHLRTQEDYDQLETYRNLGILVEQFGFNQTHPAIQRTAAYLFTCQTPAGEFRGIYGQQYSPNYSAGLTELLIKAGYVNDPRITRGLEWLIAMRQADGGWAIPFRTRHYPLSVISTQATPIEPDRSQPFSHLVTGVVLRAFAAHPTYRGSPAARAAGELLAESLFRRDRYPDRAAPEYWFRFSYPFWFTDLLSALDSLSQLGFSGADPRIERGLRWFRAQQQADGLWDLRILRGREKALTRRYLAVAICRVFKRFAG